jgi:hypothetical protein
LIANTLPFGRLWHSKANAVDYAKLAAVRIQAVIRVYEHAGNVIETHELADGFKDPWTKGAYIKSSRDDALDGSGRQLSFDHSWVATEALLNENEDIQGNRPAVPGE